MHCDLRAKNAPRCLDMRWRTRVALWGSQLKNMDFVAPLRSATIGWEPEEGVSEDNLEIGGEKRKQSYSATSCRNRLEICAMSTFRFTIEACMVAFKITTILVLGFRDFRH